MKWLPPPSVPSWLTHFENLPKVFSNCGCFCVIAFSPASNGRAAPASARSSACCALPTGTSRLIWSKTRCSRRSSSCSADSDSRQATMPQPISTPTAAGTTAPRVAITEPIVAPMPRCTSGIAAT